MSARLDYDKPLLNFCKEADPQVVLEALSDSEFDSKWHRALISLQDPTQANKSLARIVREHGITLKQLMDKYRSAAVARAHFKAQERLPQVMEGIVDDALPSEDVCPMCEGQKKVPDPQGRTTQRGNIRTVRCMKCLGKGRVRVPGQTDARKMVLQSQGMIDKHAPGAAVQVNVGVPDLMQAIRVQETLDSKTVDHAAGDE